ncbi:hypothetical protein ACIBO9_04335 [Streptomyces prunicolor]|uniref:hypothetical protein n=1 Tax=Streptomyces prunicolor TaxID=67348 RepID=UPI0037D344E0
MTTDALPGAGIAPTGSFSRRPLTLAAVAACGGLPVGALLATEPAAAGRRTRVDAATLADIGRIATEHHALGMYETERGPVVMLPRGSSVRSVAEGP